LPGHLFIVSAVFLAGLASSRPAGAHDEVVTSSLVEVGERQVSWRVDVGLGALARSGALPGDHPAAAALAERRDAIAAVLARGLAVRADGRELTAAPAGLSPIQDGSRVEQRFTFAAEAPITRLTLRVAFFPEAGEGHRAVVRVVWNGRVRTFAKGGPAEIQLALDDMAVSTVATVRQFVRWGVEHIFLGYDHLAFLLALLLGVTRLREVVLIVTSFTVAHSLTLALSSAGVVSVPARVSEALVAASIVYVAVENLSWLTATRRHRWLVTFVFGLVHGLGFATELRARLAETGGGPWAPILSFNAGVELGQVALVAAAWPLLVRVRRGSDPRDAAARQRRLARMGSMPILLLGLYWLADRLLG
jgi:hydrogenase/urease accessory protein HupE